MAEWTWRAWAVLALLHLLCWLGTLALRLEVRRLAERLATAPAPEPGPDRDVWPEFSPDPWEVAMARRPLTEEQLKAYVEGGGAACPRCGHDGLTEDEEFDDVDATTVTRVVVCDECGERVREVYTLTRAESPS